MSYISSDDHEQGIGITEKIGPDILVEDHGSLVLLKPVSERAEAWFEAHVGDAETMYWGKAVVAEPRYVPDIVEGAESDGLTVEFAA